MSTINIDSDIFLNSTGSTTVANSVILNYGADVFLNNIDLVGVNGIYPLVKDSNKKVKRIVGYTGSVLFRSISTGGGTLHKYYDFVNGILVATHIVST